MQEVDSVEREVKEDDVVEARNVDAARTQIRTHEHATPPRPERLKLFHATLLQCNISH